MEGATARIKICRKGSPRVSEKNFRDALMLLCELTVRNLVYNPSNKYERRGPARVRLLCKGFRSALLLLWLACAFSARAETVSAIEVTGTVYPDFSRILFHTSIDGAFQTALNGDQLSIFLPMPMQVNFHSMLQTLNAQVSSASLEQGGRKVVIRLRHADVRLRKLRGQDFFDIDLVTPKKTEPEQKQADAAPKKIETPPQSKKEAPKPKPEAKPKAAPPKPAKEKPAVVAKPVPVPPQKPEAPAAEKGEEAFLTLVQKTGEADPVMPV